MENKQERNSILIIDNSIAITGALKAIVNAVSNLNDHFEFIFVLPNGSSAIIFLESNSFTVYTLPFIEINKNVKNLIKYLPYLAINALRLKALIKNHNVKIIHVNDFYNLTAIIVKLLGTKIKLITHVRFMPQKFMPALANFWAKLNLKYADKLVCVSNAVREFFPQSEQIIVIPDPIPEIEKYPPKVIVDSSKENIKLLYLSNFILGKGQNYGLAAFKKAYLKNSGLRLIFAGGDMGLLKNKIFKQKLEKEVVESGLHEVVFFENFVEDVEKKIKSADIMLNFSESESFSLTCVDALYFGTPLIASDCGGPAELFEHGNSGLLVPNMDVNGMAEAMLTLAEDFNLRKKFSERGKDFVKSKFGSQNTYLKLKKEYYLLLR